MMNPTTEQEVVNGWYSVLLLFWLGARVAAAVRIKHVLPVVLFAALELLFTYVVYMVGVIASVGELAGLGAG